MTHKLCIDMSHIILRINYATSDGAGQPGLEMIGPQIERS